MLGKQLASSTTSLSSSTSFLPLSATLDATSFATSSIDLASSLPSSCYKLSTGYGFKIHMHDNTIQMDQWWHWLRSFQEQNGIKGKAYKTHSRLRGMGYTILIWWISNIYVYFQNLLWPLIKIINNILSTNMLLYDCKAWYEVQVPVI